MEHGTVNTETWGELVEMPGDSGSPLPSAYKPFRD